MHFPISKLGKDGRAKGNEEGSETPTNRNPSPQYKLKLLTP